MTQLIPVLADQLSHGLASLALGPEGAIVLMVEVRDETGYVRHHKKKIALLFSAMRHFAGELRERGWIVDYVALDDPENTHGFTGEVARAAARHRATSIRVVEPGEQRVEAMMHGWSAATGLPVEIMPDDRFIVSRAAFARWAGKRTSLVMEDFYREVRKKTGLLMEPDGTPAGERWNFDRENRKRPPRGLNYPAPARFTPDAITREVLAVVAQEFAGHFGDLEPFGFAVTRAQALEALDGFIANALPRFGDYQDAMIEGQDLLYHAMISPYLNCGLLTPREVVDAAEAAWRRGDAAINAAEGFIRQIIGWREYMRGVYWLAGGYDMHQNYLGAARGLPGFYWTAETRMKCVAASVGQTRREAYAHHIQRLMVLGNFAMLAGVDPKQVSDWYLVVYADAYEWVEAPNVIGMSQFADGGRLGSKPYAGGGAYINRMSDYCGRCHYDVAKRTGEGACPFNYLYWDFLARNEDKLKANRRMWTAYENWRRFAPERQAEIRAAAAVFLSALEPAEPGWAIAV